jgi:hypothetical protein
MMTSDEVNLGRMQAAPFADQTRQHINKRAIAVLGSQ